MPKTRVYSVWCLNKRYNGLVAARNSGWFCSVAAVGIERSQTEQKTRAEQSRIFGLSKWDLLTA